MRIPLKEILEHPECCGNSSKLLMQVAVYEVDH